MKKLSIVAFLLLFSLTFGDSSGVMEIRYATEDYIEKLVEIRGTAQPFTECVSPLDNLIKNEQDSLILIDKLYQLHVDYESGFTDYKMKLSGYPISMINASYVAHLEDIEKDITATEREITASNRVTELESRKHDSCISEQQKIYDSNVAEYKKYLEKNDFSACIRILEDTRSKLLPNHAYYKYVADSIIFVNDYKKAIEKESADAQKLAEQKAQTEAKTKAINEQKKQELRNSSDGNYLADVGIVNKQETEAGYRLNDNVLRQEVVGMAAMVGKFNLPDGYTCRSIFADVSSAKPNTWACRAIEIAADNGVVSTLNKTFRPESFITRAEALAILLKASGTQVITSSTSSFADVTVDWQINVINTALSYGFIDAGTNFNPNKNATRGEIFNMAKRILEAQN